MPQLSLKEQGLFPTSIKLFTEKTTAAKKKGTAEKKEFSFNMQIGASIIKKKQLTVVTRQLAILLDAGLPLIRSLRTLERQSRDVMVPVLENQNTSSVIEHEASTGKISEEQLFYAQTRGLNQEQAISMIVNGFCKEVMQKLPMEFAVEATKLIGINLEGSVG